MGDTGELGSGVLWGCRVTAPPPTPSSRRGVRRDKLRQPDNDIVISQDLLMELSFMPPTAIDLQFHPGYPRALESLGQKQRSPRNALAERRATPCLTGRPAHRNFPSGHPLSVSAESLAAYQNPDTTPFFTSRTNFSMDSVPRLSREGRKPLQRFAPMLSVPPPQSTAFIEARRHHLRMLMENSSGRPPPNTPEQHTSRASSTVLQGPAGLLSARSGTSRSARSRASSRTSVALRIASQRSMQNKAPDVKPIVLRMRTRGNESRTQQTDAGVTSSFLKEKREGLLPMPHIAPKMLVHQWLEVGNDKQGYSRNLSSRPTERIPLKTQHRCLGDITAKRC